ncbi:hypothetical protein BD626DRAFT_482151 [Schizophyllum amplum]|uniref:Uncharacterized protein n=1 Tax=Schizophyllum amplum TaxID=97359 RepID=A0A550CUW3_9AGAR|nr:hypothetical protein BD626DRAFT_482151 [Auriculariopsis ampla]
MLRPDTAAVLVFVLWTGVGAAAGLYPRGEQAISILQAPNIIVQNTVGDEYLLLHPRRPCILTPLGDEYMYRRPPSDAADVVSLFEMRSPSPSASPGRANNGLREVRRRRR